MRRRIRGALAGLFASLVAVASLSVVTATPAAAFGQESFGCRIAPGTILDFHPSCYNNRPATTYSVGFAVLNTSGTYTYSWSISGPYQYVITGCTSTSSGCAVAAPNEDAGIHVTVTYSQGGQSATKSATAIIRRFCGNYLC